MSELSRKEVVDMLWERGELTWKLHPIQLEMYNIIKNSPDQLAVISCARQLGKTYLMCVMSIEMCLKNPNTIVKFVAPSQKQIKRAVKTSISQIIEDCPGHLRPVFKTQDWIYSFSNGSEIQLAGTDNGNHESLRGGRSNLCIVDEAGFCDELAYVVNSVLMPTTLTTKGKMILVSTPSKSPDHQFITEYMTPALFNEKLIIKTIYDNPLIDQETINNIVKGYADGIHSTEFRREYLCEVITEKDSAVLPEFDKTLQEEIIKEWERPPFFDTYVSMDIGFKDLTFVVFAYFDFRHNKVIIEDEIVINGPKMTTEKLAAAIKAKEKELWTHPISGETMKIYRRVCDNEPILINDLKQDYSLPFEATRKDDADAALNNLRVYLSQRKIIINPRCKTLIKHLAGATWNKARDNYLRSPDMGHYDGVDAMKYLMRNIVWSHNPYPANYGYEGDNWFFQQKQTKDSAYYAKIKKTFGFS